jgi:hypothetical protein
LILKKYDNAAINAIDVVPIPIVFYYVYLCNIYMLTVMINMVDKLTESQNSPARLDSYKEIMTES